MPQTSFTPPWFVCKDLDDFFSLMIENPVQLVFIPSLCRELIFLSGDFIVGKILPGAARSIPFGNLLFAQPAHHLACSWPRCRCLVYVRPADARGRMFEVR